MDGIATIRHDGFARTSVLRALLPKDERGPCYWCGQTARFVYGTESDGAPGVTHWEDAIFCSVGCWRAYHS